MESNHEPKIKKSVRMSQEVIDKIQKLADENDRSFSYMVNKILEQA